MSDHVQARKEKKTMTYYSFRWWIRWFVPLPILIKLSKRLGNNHVWYQDKDINLETVPRGVGSFPK